MPVQKIGVFRGRNGAGLVSSGSVLQPGDFIASFSDVTNGASVGGSGNGTFSQYVIEGQVIFQFSTADLSGNTYLAVVEG
jgi:hypothetical protein